MEPDDEVVESFVEAHPHGGTLDEIAEVLGVTRQRALQIVNTAICKATAYLSRRGISHSDLSLD